MLVEEAIFACVVGVFEKKNYREASIKHVVIETGVFHNRAWRLGHTLVRGVWCRCSQLVAGRGRALPLHLGARFLGLQAQRARLQATRVAAGSSSDACLHVNSICLVSLGFFAPQNKLFSIFPRVFVTW